MFNFFRSKPLAPTTFAFLGTDMHSHILPGIDDGAPDVATSIALIRALQEMGYQRLIATPHIYKELYPNTKETIENALAILRPALIEAGLHIQVDAAAEHMMDDNFGQLIEDKTVVTLPGNRVLVETMAIAPPPQLDQYLFRLQTKGYIPVIAHPERYLYYKDQKNKYHELHERGCQLQINLLSLSGYYGNPTRDIALYLLKHQLVSFAGTDLHHQRHADLLQKMLGDAKVMRLLAEYEFLKF